MPIVEILRNGQAQRILTYLEPQEIEVLDGIPPQAVVGVITSEEILQINAIFREFLHETIGLSAPLDPDLQAAAQSHHSGRLVYVDSRVPEDIQPVPDEDILGWFHVQAGQIVPGSYLPNPAHRIDGVHGLTAALGGMREYMVRSLNLRHSIQAPP